MIDVYYIYAYMCLHAYSFVQGFEFRQRGSGSEISGIGCRGWGEGSHNLDLGLVSGIDNAANPLPEPYILLHLSRFREWGVGLHTLNLGLINGIDKPGFEKRVEGVEFRGNRVWGRTILILALSAASMNDSNWGLSAPPGSPNAPRYSPPRSCERGPLSAATP